MKLFHCKNIKGFSLFTIFVFSLIFFSFTQRAQALTATPVRFELRGNPGETITQDLMLMNEGNETQTFFTSFSNFEAQGESGNPAFTEPTDDLATWISMNSQVVLPPQKSASIPFTIRIPENAEPGGHFAVIFFGDAPAVGTNSVAIGSKVGVLVLLSVNGNVSEGGGLVDFKLKNGKFFYNTLPVFFEYRFRNDGGDRIKPEGELKIRDTFFITAKKLEGNPVEGNVLPGSTRKFDLTWIEEAREKDYEAPANFFARFFDQVIYQYQNFALGFYFAKLNLTYGLQNINTNKSLVFFVFPWQLLLVVIFLLTILMFGGKKLLQKYNRHIIEKAKVEMEKHSSRSHEK